MPFAAAVLFLGLAAFADTITVGGKVYQDVYITEGARQYYVLVPEDGTILTVSKDEVPSDDVRISDDATFRRMLRDRWRAHRQIGAGEGSVSPKHFSETARRAVPVPALSTAADRIDRYRKGDAVITVEDGNGSPVRGARVRVEQTRHAFLFGAGIDASCFRGQMESSEIERAYLQRFADLLNFATLPFYWDDYEARRGEPNHALATEVANWCRTHGITAKGHPLAWNNWDPGWLPDNPEELYALQLGRIDDCVSRFKGTIDVWDVVNEPSWFDQPINWTHGPKMTAMWAKVGQVPFTRACFERARTANPEATLLVNDWVQDARYTAVIEQLVDAEGRRLYDAIGTQYHCHGGVPTDAAIWEVLERLAVFGAPVHVTEVSIVSGIEENTGGKGRSGPWPTTPSGETRQAEDVERFYTLLFSHPSVEAITWWGLSDLNAWQDAPVGLLREDMSPKPAYDRLMELVKGKWWTVETLETDAEGKARFRGFFGDYTVTISRGEEAPTTQQFSLRKSAANTVRIILLP